MPVTANEGFRSTGDASHHQRSPDDEQNGRTKEDGNDGGGRVGLRDRLKHFTWAWFTSTMSTGGLAIALAETPHRFNGKLANLHFQLLSNNSISD